MDDSNFQIGFPPAAMGHCRIQTALVSQSHGPASFDLGNFSFRNTAKTVLLEAESPGQIISKPNCQQFLHKKSSQKLGTDTSNLTKHKSYIINTPTKILHNSLQASVMYAINCCYITILKRKNSPISSHAKITVYRSVACLWRFRHLCNKFLRSGPKSSENWEIDRKPQKKSLTSFPE